MKILTAFFMQATPLATLQEAAPIPASLQEQFGQDLGGGPGAGWVDKALWLPPAVIARSVCRAPWLPPALIARSVCRAPSILCTGPQGRHSPSRPLRSQPGSQWPRPSSAPPGCPQCQEESCPGPWAVPTVAPQQHLSRSCQQAASSHSESLPRCPILVQGRISMIQVF